MRPFAASSAATCCAPVLGGILEQRDPSVCLSHGAAAYAIGTLAACGLATTGQQRCADCQIRLCSSKLGGGVEWWAATASASL